MYPQPMFSARILKISFFFSNEIFNFYIEKNNVCIFILYGQLFIMKWTKYVWICLDCAPSCKLQVDINKQPIQKTNKVVFDQK